MIELIIGSIIGALVSLTIAEIYHRRAGKELQMEIEKSREANSELSKQVKELEEWHETNFDTLQVILKMRLAGLLMIRNFPISDCLESIMIAAGENPDLVFQNFIHQPVGVVDTARPATGKIVF